MHRCLKVKTVIIKTNTPLSSTEIYNQERPNTPNLTRHEHEIITRDCLGQNGRQISSTL